MERIVPNTQFADDLRAELEKVGLGSAELVSSAPKSAAFGNTASIFRIGSLLLRVTLERGQRFLDVASQAEPNNFYQFDDIEIAMGWRSIDQVVAKREPEPIKDVLQRLQANLDVLMHAFSEDRERLTRARIEKAAEERGKVFTARLRGRLQP